MAVLGGVDLIARDVISAARYMLKDAERNRYSDEEMLSALNGSLDIVYELAARLRYAPLERTAILRAGSAIPSDCASIIRVTDGSGVELLPVASAPEDSTSYRVTAGRLALYASGEEPQPVTILYTSFPEQLSDPDEEIPLPDIWRAALREMVLLMVRGKSSAARDMAYACVLARNGDKASRMPDRDIWR